MEKFRTDNHSEIMKCEVIKETRCRVVFNKKFTSWKDKSVYVREDTENIESAYHSWHDTFEEAKNHLIEMNTNKLNSHLINVDNTRKTLTEISELQESNLV